MGAIRSRSSGFVVRFEVKALGLWREVSRSPAKSKLVGCRQWPLSSSSLSLSFSLCAPARSHLHTPSLASSANRGASMCGSFRLARCVGQNSQALCASKRGSACERGIENV